MDFNEFLLWEQSTRDTTDFKKIYVDTVDDLHAGLALSHIVYWYLPSKEGGTKLRAQKAGTYWIAVRRYDWWERTRMSPKQADRALGFLEKAGMIEKRTFKFKGEPTVHVRIREENFLPRIKQLIDKPLQNPFFPKREEPISLNGKMDITNNGTIDLPIGETPYTEIPALISEQGNKHRCCDPQESQQTASVPEQKSLESDIDQAIAEAWETDAPGYIHSLRKTLLGQHRKGDEHYASNVKPPATPQEIRELGDFYRRRNPGMKMVSTPPKIQNWLYDVRELVDKSISYGGHIIPLKIKVPPRFESHREIMFYVEKYYPEELARLRSIFKRLDNAAPPEYKMIINAEYSYEDERVIIKAPIPVELKTWVEIIEYLRVNDQAECERIEEELERIDDEREQEDNEL